MKRLRGERKKYTIYGGTPHCAYISDNCSARAITPRSRSRLISIRGSFNAIGCITSALEPIAFLYLRRLNRPLCTLKVTYKKIMMLYFHDLLDRQICLQPKMCGS
jgi:hypothetical protein